MDYYKMIPDNFFSLLASKNKRLYLATIIQSYKIYENGSILGIEKKIVVDDLVLFLEKNTFLYNVEDEEDEEADPKSKRDLVNYILRRMEECGWIYIDVTNDYEEFLNFSDMAIIICEALLSAYPVYDEAGGYEGADYELNVGDYQGYIFTVYSLLNNVESTDFALVFDLVYNNTKQLIRALRRLDTRLKDYIAGVMDTADIKELMDRLMTFKTEIYDQSYLKMKTSDNINRYRLSIVSKLEEMASDELAMSLIINDYTRKYHSKDLAEVKVTKAIDEVIDVFNSIDNLVTEIDNKNRNYINSTIGKVKFLLSEDENVIGKLNTILKFVKNSNEQGKLDRAIKTIGDLFSFNNFKIFAKEGSLYVPRGSYERNYNQDLDESQISIELDAQFLAQFDTFYDENEVAKYLSDNMQDGVFEAKSLVSYDTEEQDVLKVFLCLMFASDHDYEVKISAETIDNKLYTFKDFIIEQKKDKEI